MKIHQKKARNTKKLKKSIIVGKKIPKCTENVNMKNKCKEVKKELF